MDLELLSSEETNNPTTIENNNNSNQPTANPKSNIFQKETTNTVLQEWEKQNVDLNKAASKIAQSKRKKKFLINSIIIGIFSKK
jgi:hypothetical protein